MSPMSEREQLRRSWIANADAWTDAVRNQRIESRRLVTDAAIVQAVLDTNPHTVLDLGCGEGWLARALASRGLDVTGIDASAPLIEAANALGGARFIAGTYDEIDGAFDTIAANFSILDGRVPDLGGRLVVQTIHPAFVEGPYEDGWRIETFNGAWREPMPWYFRTLGSWLQAIGEAHYDVEEIREPLYPDRKVPASIIFLCRSRRTSPRDRAAPAAPAPA
jgi:SAM-dependent methyltransferase